MGLYIFGWVYPTSFGHFGVQWQVCPNTSGSKAPTGDLYATDCEKWRRRKRIYSKSRHGLMGWMYSNIPSKKAQMHPLWRTLTTWQIFMGTNSPYNRLSCGQILDMTDYPWEMWRKFVMWRNLSTWQICMWKNSPHNRLSCGQILDMTDYHVEKILHMRNVKKVCNVEK